MHYYNYGIYDKTDTNFKRQKHPSNLGFNFDNEFKPVRIDKIDGKLLDNIVEFNKNLTQDEINGTTYNNILKYNNLLTLSEFDKMLIAKQYQKLYGKTEEANIERKEDFENNRFINLSLYEIFNKFILTMIELMNELPLAYEKNEIKLEIFTKNDRLIYIGLLFIILAIFIYFISLTK
jgi:hypothetical protein